MQLQTLSTDIEKINRKEINNEESDKYDTKERDKIQISDEVTMISRKKRNDDDDQVNKYSDQGRSEEESEEKDQTEISKRDALESDILEPVKNMKKTKRNY